MQFEVSEAHAMRETRISKGKHSHKSQVKGSMGDPQETWNSPSSFQPLSPLLSVSSLVSHQTRTCIHDGKHGPLQC